MRRVVYCVKAHVQKFTLAAKIGKILFQLPVFCSFLTCLFKHFLLTLARNILLFPTLNSFDRKPISPVWLFPGASLQRQGKYREAIKYFNMVLEISKREGEDSGNTEAYGAIADCYTELGDLERAGKFYDQYIARLESD